MMELINENGGYCMTTLNPTKVTHILCSKNSNYKHNAKYRIAQENELPIYDEKWLFDAVETQSIPKDSTTYLLDGKIDPETRKSKLLV